MSLANPLWLAASSLARSPRRTLLTSAALAAAVAGALLFYGFTRHTYWGLSESFARGGNGHLQVAAEGWFDSPAPEEHRTPLSRLQAARQALEADPELGPLLLATSLRRQLSGMLASAERSSVFVGSGDEVGAEAAIAPLAEPVAGQPLSGAPADSVVLGSPLAARLGVGPGDWVTAMVTTDGGMTNAVDLQVAGLARTGAEELDQRLARLPLETAMALTVADTADAVVLALRDTDDTDRALAAAERVLNEFDGLVARPWYERAHYYIAVRALYDRIFGIFEALMVLVTALSLSHAVAAVVAERRAEIALLRVVGLTRRQVAALFVAEGALLGLVGAVLGAALANGVAFVVAQAGGIPMPPPPGFTVGYDALFHFDGLGYAIVLPATVLAAMVASAVPAVRAAGGPLSRGLGGLVALFVLLPGLARADEPDPQAAAHLLARADAARALPPDQLCRMALEVADEGETVTWAVQLHGENVLARTTSLPEGRGQAVLQDGQSTWFQTEGMQQARRVGAAARLMGQLTVADLLRHTLSEAWEVERVEGETVHVRARPGGPAPTPKAALVFERDRLVSASFQGSGGRVVRTAQWDWSDDRVQVDLVDAGGRRTTVRTTPPECAPGALDVDPKELW